MRRLRDAPSPNPHDCGDWESGDGDSIYLVHCLCLSIGGADHPHLISCTIVAEYLEEATRDCILYVLCYTVILEISIKHSRLEITIIYTKTLTKPTPSPLYLCDSLTVLGTSAFELPMLAHQYGCRAFFAKSRICRSSSATVL